MSVSGCSYDGSQSSSQDICRICHCEGEACMPLLAPCCCCGSLRYVHQTCLQQWIKSSNTKCCELCKFPYIMNIKTKPFIKWERLELGGLEHRKLLLSVLINLMVLMGMLWSLYVFISRIVKEIKGNEGLEWPFWTKLIVVAIAISGGTVFMYIQCKIYLHLCHRWKAFNRVIYVQNPPEKVPLCGHQRGEFQLEEVQVVREGVIDVGVQPSSSVDQADLVTISTQEPYTPKHISPSSNRVLVSSSLAVISSEQNCPSTPTPAVHMHSSDTASTDVPKPLSNAAVCNTLPPLVTNIHSASQVNNYNIYFSTTSGNTKCTVAPVYALPHTAKHFISSISPASTSNLYSNDSSSCSASPLASSLSTGNLATSFLFHPRRVGSANTTLLTAAASVSQLPRTHSKLDELQAVVSDQTSAEACLPATPAMRDDRDNSTSQCSLSNSQNDVS